MPKKNSYDSKFIRTVTEALVPEGKNSPKHCVRFGSSSKENSWFNSPKHNNAKLKKIN